MERWRRPIELPHAPTVVLRRLREQGHECYAVGGAVRDALLEREIHDVDVATAARPEEVARIFHRTHGIGEAFGVMLVVVEGVPVEVASFRSESGYVDGRHPTELQPATMARDAERRDFSINAFYYDPELQEILDPCAALADLRARRLRAIGDPSDRFREDHLRLLRAVRFAVELDLSIEPETWDAMRAHADLAAQVSKERLRGEMEHMLCGRAPGDAMRMLQNCGMLAGVLPEIEAMIGVQQPPQYHPEGDVFTHTCLALDQLEAPSPALAWGTLLHDVGKPPTFRMAERIRFDGHVEVGMEMGRSILQRLRVDGETTERVVALIQHHLRFIDAPKMRQATLKRFLRLPHFDEHLELHRADCLASHGDLSLHEFCRDALARLAEEELRPAALLRGADLRKMGYPPGPLFGEILENLETEQLEGRLTDREQALRFVRERWPLPS